jgi:replicative DNA helicase
MLQTANFIAISKTTGRLAGLPIMLDDDGSQSAATICAKARRWRRDPSIFKTGDERGMILIDYLQMIKRQPGSKAQNKEQEVTETFRELKAMAKELKVALVCLASLSRECEKRNDKRPIPSDLRDSGNIESDADSIMMIYRDEAYNDKTDEPGVAELIIRKARNGSVGMVKTRWHAEHTSFADL